MKHSQHLPKFLDKDVALYSNNRTKCCDEILREITKEYVIIETDKNIWKVIGAEPISCLRIIPWHQIDFIDSKEIKNE